MIYQFLILSLFHYSLLTEISNSNSLVFPLLLPSKDILVFTSSSESINKTQPVVCSKDGDILNTKTPLHFSYHKISNFLTINNTYLCVYADENTNNIKFILFDEEEIINTLEEEGNFDGYRISLSILSDNRILLSYHANTNCLIKYLTIEKENESSTTLHLSSIMFDNQIGNKNLFECLEIHNIKNSMWIIF